jgi:hypothetical protein
MKNKGRNKETMMDCDKVRNKNMKGRAKNRGEEREKSSRSLKARRCKSGNVRLKRRKSEKI